MRKPKVFSIAEPVLRTYTWVGLSCTWDEFRRGVPKRLREAMGEKPELGVAGTVRTAINTSSGAAVRFLWIKDFSKTPSGLAPTSHEVSHLVTSALKERGIEDDETRGYLTEFFMEAILRGAGLK